MSRMKSGMALPPGPRAPAAVNSLRFAHRPLDVLTEWHARYAAYDSPEHMLSASIAVARAESFFEIPLIGRFFKPSSDESRACPRQIPVEPDVAGPKPAVKPGPPARSGM